jgi:uncharacterized membrane-anchored protein YjiN (DUF445 family)
LKQGSDYGSDNTAAHSKTPPASQIQPETLTAGGLRQFLSKWGTKFAAQLKTSLSHPFLQAEPQAKTVLFATRAVKCLNCLNRPLFWWGIIFLGWLLVELVLPQAARLALVAFQPLVMISGAVAIGYWTNWCAVKMIFYPRVKNAVWWGLIPARRQELTELITESMVTKLVSPEIVREYLTKDDLLRSLVTQCVFSLNEITREKEFRSELKEILARYLRRWLNEPATAARLNGLIQSRIADPDGESLTGKVLGWTKSLWGPVVETKISQSLTDTDWLAGPLREAVDKWLDELPMTLAGQTEYLETLIVKLITAGLENLNLKAVIRTQLEQMDESQFEKILTGNLSPELVFIQVCGGILGGLVGAALFYNWLRLGLLALGIGLAALYRVTREKG